MSLFPMFVKLQGRTVVVVGAGVVAEGKIPGLFAAGARARVIAPVATAQIAAWAAEGNLEWQRREFSAEDLTGASLAIAATAAPGVNQLVFREAEARGIFCNAVDDIENCRFYYGAVVQRGDLQIAISTNGKSPALAQRIRKELEVRYAQEYGAWLDRLGAARDALRAKAKGFPGVTAILHRLASGEMFKRFLLVKSRRAHPDRIKSESETRTPHLSGRNQETAATVLGRDDREFVDKTTGTVFLVGAGPGDPELLTRRALRLLQTAQIVLHDSLVSREVLAEISPAAQVIDVGKRAGQKLLTQEEINSLLVSYAQDHQMIVRLKGGDPGVFGRGGEEIDALRRAGVRLEIVPGITAATAAAAAAGIALTDRRVASQVLLTTFSRGSDGAVMDWGAVTSSTTMVLYMPGPDYAEVSARLLDGGLPADLPCAVVSSASRDQQMVRWSNISALAREEKLPAPALLIVGRVASQYLGETSEKAGNVLQSVETTGATVRVSLKLFEEG
jgi:uroporphyrin-III C-methyltransferase/precorrin-2 dehydrogenase/sirohydrochlorin ferrochelatase